VGGRAWVGEQYFGLLLQSDCTNIFQVAQNLHQMTQISVFTVHWALVPVFGHLQYGKVNAAIDQRVEVGMA